MKSLGAQLYIYIYIYIYLLKMFDKFKGEILNLEKFGEPWPPSLST